MQAQVDGQGDFAASAFFRFFGHRYLPLGDFAVAPGFDDEAAAVGIGSGFRGSRACFTGDNLQGHKLQIECYFGIYLYECRVNAFLAIGGHPRVVVYATRKQDDK